MQNWGGIYISILISLKNNIRNYLLEMKLRNKVWVAFVVLSIVQVIFIGVVVYFYNSNIIIENEKMRLNQLINVVNQDLESRMEAFNSNSLDIVISSDVKQNLNLNTALEVGKAKRSIVSFLNEKSISRSGLLDISIIDMKSNTYCVRASYYLPPGFNIQNTSVFKEAAKYNGGMVWLSKNEINDAYAKDSILLSPLGGISGVAVIKDYTSNEISGLLIMVIKKSYFANIDYFSEKLSNVSLFLVSPDKSIILPLNSTEGVLNKDILSKIDTKSQRGSFAEENSDINDARLVSYVENNAMGWYLVSVNSSNELAATFYQTVKILLITLLLSLISCFFIASAISRYITKGLDALAAKMKCVGKGDFYAKINSNRSDEVGQLSNVFDSMVMNTNKLITLKYEQELLTKKAEFKALQAQINPHFLYNTLDMINWRLIEKGEEEISQSIVAIGNLLRYSIDYNFINVPLSDEVKNVEDYLFLRHANSKGLFEYEINVENGEVITLPKLTLQPLVENAIIHGFKGRQRGNRIAIRGYADKEKYCIKIADNGIGIPEEKVLRIKDKDKDYDNDNEIENEGSDTKNHIGIRNVEERIRHIYGEDAELIIESEFGYGTTIMIVIRMKTEDIS